MAGGGARPGAGRPKGSTIVDLARGSLTERLAARKLLPMDVMLEAMDVFYSEYKESYKKAEAATSYIKKREHRNEARSAIIRSCNVADKVAPYMHPRLTSTTVIGDDTKPPVRIERTQLGKLSADELTLLETLLSKAQE